MASEAKKHASSSESHSKSHPGSKAQESTHKSGEPRHRKVEGAGQATTDHKRIRKWVEERGGKPACVRGTGDKNDIGMLRIDMPGYTGEDKLEHIAWDEWFGKFEEKGLSFLYQDETKSGTKSNFNKLVSRENAE